MDGNIFVICFMKKTKRHTKKNNKGPRNSGISALKIPRQVGLILPDRYRTKLRYWKQVSMDFTVSNVRAIRFSPSSAYDVDPLVASTAMSGFAELATLYNSYRVLGSQCKVTFLTTSAANPVNVSLTPTNLDPGASPSSAYVFAAKEQPYAKFGTTGLTGSPPLKLNSSLTTERMYGSRAVLFDDSFAALVTTVPTNNWWWVISAYSYVLDPSLSWVTIIIETDVEFYDRTFLLV